MALLINDDCTACDACVEECPNEAITRRFWTRPSSPPM